MNSEIIKNQIINSLLILWRCLIVQIQSKVSFYTYNSNLRKTQIRSKFIFMGKHSCIYRERRTKFSYYECKYFNRVSLNSVPNLDILHSRAAVIIAWCLLPYVSFSSVQSFLKSSEGGLGYFIAIISLRITNHKQVKQKRQTVGSVKRQYLKYITEIWKNFENV